MPTLTQTAKYAVAVMALAWSASANAATDPTGLWFDHNGRGAVEIKDCADGSGLCGFVVHIKDPANISHCGQQILGKVTPDGGGWIYSPDRGRRYDVALTRLSDDKLRVVGNAGSRFFSRTFTWNRAPDDIARCDTTTAAAPVKAASPKPEPVAASAEPAAAPSTYSGGASRSGSMALTAIPRTTKPAPAAKPAAAVAGTGASSAGTKTTSKAPKTARVADATASASEEPRDSGSGRTCKYRIPYVGRTISVPCRD